MKTPRLSALIVIGALLSVPVTMSPAEATPCNSSKLYGSATKSGKTKILKRVPGKRSVFNDGPTTATRTVTFGRSATRGVTKRWEVGGSASAGWGPVKAEISGKYGEDYVKSDTVTSSESVSQPILPRHTAWMRVDFYERKVHWTAYRYYWNGAKKRCVKRTTEKAYWGAPKSQVVIVQRKGRRFPK